MYPLFPGRPAWRDEQPAGYSYAALLVRADREAVLRELSAARFSGWIGPQEADWVVAVPARRRQGVKVGKENLEALAAAVAQRFDDVVVAVSVHDERVLRLAMWQGGRHLGSYLSNPAYKAADDDASPEPEGVEHVAAFAAACGRPDNVDDLTELLADMLDEESQNESDRLLAAVRLLDLPRWLIAAPSLPRDPPSGPPAAQFTRLFRGRTGIVGRALAWITGPIRWRRGRWPMVID
jgi:hypothetical protein